MNTARAERMLALACAALVAAAFAQWRAGTRPPPSVDIVPSVLHRRLVNVLLDEDSLNAAGDVVVSGDPFRVANEPTSVAFSPGPDGGQPTAAITAAASRPPHPALILRAIVGGPPWQAIVDGLPGQPPGTIVNAGMLISGLKIRSVVRDTVFVQGSDTAWKLTLGRVQP